MTASSSRITTDATRGYLFVDIDGVLSPEARLLGDDWTRRLIGGYWVWTSARLGCWLETLLERGVQIVWATTWIEQSDALDELAGALGLPGDLPCIDVLEWSTADWDDCGKRPGIVRWLTQHEVDVDLTPVVWADDCLGPGDLSWAGRFGVGAVKVPAVRGLDDMAQRRRIIDALDLDDDLGRVGHVRGEDRRPQS